MLVGKAVSDIDAATPTAPAYGVVQDLDGLWTEAVANYTAPAVAKGATVLIDRVEACAPGGAKFVLVASPAT